jgi:hypothetical protein
LIEPVEEPLRNTEYQEKDRIYKSNKSHMKGCA